MDLSLDLEALFVHVCRRLEGTNMKNWSALKSKYKDLGGGDDRYKYRMKSCVLTC